MSVNHLLREKAPITADGWALLDDEARERLLVALAGRRLVDFAGPRGWLYSATDLGRVEPIADVPGDGLSAARRRVLPLAELRAPFTVSREELRAGDRGADDVDLDALAGAAHTVAVAENVAVFHGWPAAGFAGITEASPFEVVAEGDGVEDYSERVAKGVELLHRAGIAGPYALALGTDDHTAVMQTVERGGYPLLEHLRRIADGPIVWAPGVRGAVVVSQRGGDYLFESGQDLAVGYARHDDDTVELYLEETFSFRIATSEAAVALAPVAES